MLSCMPTLLLGVENVGRMWAELRCLRKSSPLLSPSRIALTKLDVLDGFEEIKIGTGYRLDGKLLKTPPGNGPFEVHSWGDERLQAAGRWQVLAMTISFPECRLLKGDLHYVGFGIAQLVLGVMR